MKALNELYIYLICCWIFATLFAAYLAIKLRAYRIANAKLFDIAKGAVAKLAEINVEVDRILGEKGGWIKDANNINFKINEGRQFELIMHKGNKLRGKVNKWGKSPQAWRVNNDPWYFKTNTDGTLAEGAELNNRFRWID
jgi:hypothetical protein